MKKQKFKNLAIFLLCSVFLTLFEPFGAHLQMRPSIEVFQVKAIK